MQLQPYEQEHLDRLRALLPECTVLLKSNGAFPLEQPCKLALYGNGARRTVKGGTGSGEVNSRFFDPIETCLANAGFTITTQAWLDGYDAVRVQAKKQFVQAIKARAKRNHTNAIVEGMGAVMPEPEYELPLEGDGDVAVYVLSRISGEGNDRTFDRGDIRLTEREERDILALQTQYAKFMLVLNVGGPVDLSPVSAVENILVLSQLGVDTGSALADLLLGKAYPSGKLATTWATVDTWPQVGDFGGKEDTLYREGVYVGYRYFDSAGVKPLFPFGYGLGYTSFAVSDVHAAALGETLIVSATVQNTGPRPGKEVVQLYVSVPAGKLDQPYQMLAAFAKTKEVTPGAAETVTMTFSLSELAGYDTDAAAYLLEAGDYLLRVGVSSAETEPCAIVRLEETVTVEKTRHIGGTPDFADWQPDPRTAETLPENLPVFPVAAADVATRTPRYGRRVKVNEKLKTLPDEKLAYLNVGVFDPKGGVGSIIGAAAQNVAGAAGETTDQLRGKGIPSLVMADGPAGLRLSREYFVDAKGAHSMGQSMPESMLEMLPPIAAKAMDFLTPKPKKGAVIRHQYATAIPIGTAIAQSWDPALAEACGDIVGEEMERFGVHLWLAPALNLHRDVRCGRNFEYFSEDPLLSGVFAAAITKGVQRHPGCGVTIKHYAANNQETNRYNSNSQVSERALREMYLRGFAICVRAAQPYALMTSYNLLNGQHTSERRDLIEDFLRGECGFEGIVMTDWVTAQGILSKGAKYAPPTAAGVAAAGGDLFMPGSKGDHASILQGLKDGTLTRAQLEANATRVLHMIFKLTKAHPHGK